MKEYENPTISDIFREAMKVRDFETLDKFYGLMPNWVDWVATISLIGVCCGIWVLFMGIITDNDE